MNLTINFMYELPIPKIKRKDQERIINIGLSLFYLKNDKNVFKAFFEELGKRLNENQDPIHLRAELEIFIARELFKINKEEWEYITSKFVYGEKSETKQELDKFIAKSLEIF